MQSLLSTKEVAEFLGVNEKKIYTLITEKGLPATKVTGKWLFPSRLVEQWVEEHTENHPGPNQSAPSSEKILVIAGSNDLLLDAAASLYMQRNEDKLCAFSNMGSLGGLKALRRGQCHMAASHLAGEAEENGEYNFGPAAKLFSEQPAVVDFCRREQGLALSPKVAGKVKSLEDVVEQKLTVVNRKPGTGTRQLFEKKLTAAGLSGADISGFDTEMDRHLDVGLAVLSGRADAGPCIRAVAGLLGLKFFPFGWERFDLLIPKEGFFEESMQRFLGMLLEDGFRNTASRFEGYDTSSSGRMRFPGT